MNTVTFKFCSRGWPAPPYSCPRSAPCWGFSWHDTWSLWTKETNFMYTCRYTCMFQNIDRKVQHENNWNKRMICARMNNCKEVVRNLLTRVIRTGTWMVEASRWHSLQFTYISSHFIQQSEHNKVNYGCQCIALGVSDMFLSFYWHSKLLCVFV